MATRLTIRGQVHRAVANSEKITASDIESIMAAENSEILEAHSWTRRRGTFLLNLVPTVTLSGCTVTNNSSTVLAPDITEAMEGRCVRVTGEDQFYFIGSVVAGVSFTLVDRAENSVAYPGETDTDADLTVFKYLYTVASDAETVLSVVAESPLREISADELEVLDPQVKSSASDPSYWGHAGRTSADVLEIFIWPPASQAKTLRGRYLKSGSLDSDDSIPLYDSALLKWKSAETAANFLFGRTGDPAWSALADKYHKFYFEAKDEAIEADLMRSSAPTKISPAEGSALLSDEFMLNRDLWRP